MRVLYYCPEYYFRHGGRTHARGFFGALEKLSSVSDVFLYPKSDPAECREGITAGKKIREKLWFLPYTLKRIIRLFRPRGNLTRALITEITANDCDALVIRTGIAQPSIREIKIACPDTLICLEINSAFFDESLDNVPFRRVFQKCEVNRYDQADAIVVVSSYLKTYLEKRGISAEKIVVNQNGVDIDAVALKGQSDVREKYGIPEDSFLLGYIGGMEAFRRFPEVIEYMAALRKAGNDDIYFLIVGDGADMPAVRAEIATYSDVLGSAVKLVGWQEHSEVPKFLSTFDLAIFPFTNAYCSPLKLFEYLAAGVPTLGPDTPTVREVFEDGIHLKLVKQDGSDFVDTVLDIKNNPELRKMMSQNGRQLVLEKYTWKNNAERVVAHIRKTRENTERRDQ